MFHKPWSQLVSYTLTCDTIFFATKWWLSNEPLVYSVVIKFYLKQFFCLIVDFSFTQNNKYISPFSENRTIMLLRLTFTLFVVLFYCELLYTVASTLKIKMELIQRFYLRFDIGDNISIKHTNSSYMALAYRHTK